MAKSDGLDGRALRDKVKDTLAKVDWNINNNHRASVRYTKTDQVEPIFQIILRSLATVSTRFS